MSSANINFVDTKIVIVKTLMFIPLFLALTLSGFSQTIEPAPEDKAVIYFVRTVKGGMGSLANTYVFDAWEPIGMLTYQNFIRFECEPGEHMFWVTRSGISLISYTYYKQFVDADLLAGKIYLVEVRIQMEGIEMDPIDPLNNEKELFRVKKVLNRKSSIKANKWMEKRKYGVAKIDNSWAEMGMNKYEKFEEKGKIKFLDPEWFLEVEELFLDKKDEPHKADL